MSKEMVAGLLNPKLSKAKSKQIGTRSCADPDWLIQKSALKDAFVPS